MVDLRDKDGYFTKEGLREWLSQEVPRIRRALNAQIADATDFVTGFATGKLTEEQVTERIRLYERRWADSPLRARLDSVPDETFLHALDGKLDAREDARWKQLLQRKPRDSQSP